MSNKQFIDEVTVSDRTSSMTNPRTNDSLKTTEAVGEGCLQGSRPSVARAHGVAPAVLFRWRALDKQGALTAIQAGEATVSARKYEAALEEIKRLRRLLGQATADNALLKDAVEYMQSKKWIAR